MVGLIFVGWGNLELYPGPLNLVDAPGKIMRDEALMRFAYAALSGTWALLVIAALALRLFSRIRLTCASYCDDDRRLPDSLHRRAGGVLRAFAALFFHH